jgi:hypothetical protein
MSTANRSTTCSSRTWVSRWSSALEGNTSARRVGLLNIGEGVIKGNEVVKQAAELLRASGLNFRGNVEGNDIFEGHHRRGRLRRFRRQRRAQDVRGPRARMIGGFIREELRANLADQARRPGFAARAQPASSIAWITGVTTAPAWSGLRGIVIKSHGSADSLAFEQALRRAHEAARNGLLERIAQAVPRLSGRDPESRNMTLYSRIVGTGSALPERLVTNADLVARTRRPRHRKLGRLDLRAHRHPPASSGGGRRDQQHAGRARGACRARGGRRCEASDVDLIIVATSTPDFVFPSTACLIQNQAGRGGCGPRSTSRRCAAGSCMAWRRPTP